MDRSSFLLNKLHTLSVGVVVVEKQLIKLVNLILGKESNAVFTVDQHHLAVAVRILRGVVDETANVSKLGRIQYVFWSGR